MRGDMSTRRLYDLSREPNVGYLADSILDYFSDAEVKSLIYLLEDGLIDSQEEKDE